MDTTTPSSGSYTVIGSHVPTDVADEITRLARENERSVSGEVRLALRRHIRTAREAQPVVTVPRAA